MTGLLTFIKDEYKKHWKAFCIISASYALFLKLIYDIAIFFNYSFIHLALIFMVYGVAISMIYSLIIKGKIIDIKTIFKKYIKISLYMLGVGVIAMVLLMIGMLMLKPVINNTFLMILSISLMIVPIIFLVYISDFSLISCVEYDITAKESIKKAGSLFYGYEFKTVLSLLLVEIFGCISSIANTIDNIIGSYLVFILLSVIIFPIYNIMLVYVYNICDNREPSDKNTIFKKICGRVF